MSDALTDLAMDEKRARRHMSYLDAVQQFLKDPTEGNKKVAIDAAISTDQVPRGFWGGRTSLADDASDLLEKLKGNDKQAWAKFLFSLEGEYEFGRFKKLSPFCNQLLIAVDYGCGFVNFHGDLKPFIAQLIAQGKGWKTYDADDYIVALPQPEPEKTEVFWVGCGIQGSEGPRSANTPSTVIFRDDD